MVEHHTSTFWVKLNSPINVWDDELTINVLNNKIFNYLFAKVKDQYESVLHV